MPQAIAQAPEALDLGRRDRAPRSGLRRRLVASDIVALVAGWVGGLGLAPFVTGAGAPAGGRFLWAAGACAVCMALMTTQNLYLARVCSVRSAELQGLSRSVLGTTLVLVCVEQSVRTHLPLREVWVAGFVTFWLLAASRAAFASWLRQQRTAGRFTRDLVLVGADHDAVELAAVTREHPEFGFRVCGYVGQHGLADLIGAPHLGDIADVRCVVDRTNATGVVVIPSALEAQQLNDMVRDLLEHDVHVHLSGGLRGIAQHRFRPTPLAYEPLFYVEPVNLMSWQLIVKRVTDIVGSVSALVLTMPVIALAALAIKINSRGPVLFRQERVGRNNHPFVLYKLRTMVTDAEELRDLLLTQNERSAGPLFKLADDPRTTRVGQFLRRTSIDELPQLFNVLRGSMSLVGPRPALPAEVAQFDAKLRRRSSVTPGLTGLWQIESRDNPSFGPYRRLDLYYIENWSPLLDLRILLATVASVVGRALRLGRPRHDIDEPIEIVLD